MAADAAQHVVMVSETANLRANVMASSHNLARQSAAQTVLPAPMAADHVVAQADHAAIVVVARHVVILCQVLLPWTVVTAATVPSGNRAKALICTPRTAP